LPAVSQESLALSRGCCLLASGFCTAGFRQNWQLEILRHRRHLAMGLCCEWKLAATPVHMSQFMCTEEANLPADNTDQRIHADFAFRRKLETARSFSEWL